MSVIRVSGLDAGYDGVRVVHGLDLGVSEGEIVALLGRNGAGKTTTLRAISGLLPPLAGSVTVLGHRVVGSPHRLARLGMRHVADHRGLFRSLTVAENLRLGRPKGKPPVAVDDWFPSLLPLLQRPTGVLSGGEQQMLAVARSLIGQPKALLVDELTLSVSPGVASQLLEVVRRASRDWGTAVLVVEQHVQLALSLADRAYVLAGGEVALEGPAAALAGRRDLLEASYLGDPKP